MYCSLIAIRFKIPIDHLSAMYVPVLYKMISRCYNIIQVKL